MPWLINLGAPQPQATLKAGAVTAVKLQAAALGPACPCPGSSRTATQLWDLGNGVPAAGAQADRQEQASA